MPSGTSTFYFQPELELMPIDQVRKLQNRRLREMVTYMYARQPFYKRQWADAGIDHLQVQSVEDLHLLPFTRKADLRAHYPFGLLACSRRELARIHASSGTTGKPTVMAYTQGDLGIFADVVARSLACAGARPGMRLHNAYGYGLFTGGLGLHAGAERLGMAVIPVSGGMTERQVMLLQDLEPEVLCCTPSYALALSDQLRTEGVDPESLHLQYALLGAEPWTEATRREVEAGLKVSATNIYGLSEIIGPGVSQEDCLRKGGSHIWEDHFFPEVVDPETGVPLPLGEQGVLVLTTLTKRAMPLMRYWTNDICSLYYDEDADRTHVKMSPVAGRHDDMLIIRGVNLYPSQVEEVLADFPELSANHQLVVSREGRLDELEVRVEQLGEGSVADLQSKVARSIKERIGLSAIVQIEPLGSLPRSQGGKLNRVLDQRKA